MAGAVDCLGFARGVAPLASLAPPRMGARGGLRSLRSFRRSVVFADAKSKTLLYVDQVHTHTQDVSFRF